MQQPGDVCPAFVVGGGGSRVAARVGDDEPAAMPLLGGPEKEVADVVAGWSYRLASHRVGLCGVGEGGAALGEPAQEPGGGGDLEVGVAGVGAGPGAVLGGAA